jgi:hypothetical protein
MRSLCAVSLVLATLALAVPAVSAAATPKPTTITIVVGKNGVAGGLKKATIKKGSNVVVVVRTTLPAEAVHLHGYDVERPVKGSKATLPFTAKLTGVFELELHLHGGNELKIAELTIK